jgi:integrase
MIYAVLVDTRSAAMYLPCRKACTASIMASRKLTKQLIESVVPDTVRRVVIYDSDVPGFHIVVRQTGRKTFAFAYRTKTHRKATLTLGPYPALSVARAREMAEVARGQVIQGADPALERTKSRAAPAIADLCDRFLEDYVGIHTKPTTAREYRGLVEARIRPNLGNQKVAQLTRAQIVDWHHSMRQTRREANHALAVLSKMLSLAEVQWALRADNPCKGIKRYPEGRRERFLSAAEFARLGDTLLDCEMKGMESSQAIDAIRLLIFTGCRLSEILELRWPDVDLERSCLRLRDSKTGARVVHLGAPAMEILARLGSHAKDERVVTGSSDRPLGLHKPWNRIRKRSGLADVRLHDLRHSFASVAAAAGFGLPVIGKLLGHNHPATTSRYAHLSDDPLKHAAERVTQRIAAAMSSAARSDESKANGVSDAPAHDIKV